jgi:threonine aldolase
LHALDHHVERLADDHARAARLGAALGTATETNIVPLTVPDATMFAAAAREQGVLLGVVGPQRVRAVVHLDVDDAAIDHATTVLSGLVAV